MPGTEDGDSSDMLLPGALCASPRGGVNTTFLATTSNDNAPPIQPRSRPSIRLGGGGWVSVLPFSVSWIS
eukprot:707259-Rhodomonas_salina.2